MRDSDEASDDWVERATDDPRGILTESAAGADRTPRDDGGAP